MALFMVKHTKIRCTWCGSDPLYVHYHDTEWGVPEHDDRALFEKLILDGFQAGLSWFTILKKRENFRKAFVNFEPEKIVRFSEKKIASLMSDAGIVRNRAKISGTIDSAKAYLQLRDSGQSFNDFLWSFVEHETICNRWSSLSDLPAQTTQSQHMSKALKKLGFRFCGPTICYAFMQAVGMVNDHMVECFRYAELQKGGESHLKKKAQTVPVHH
ncbi:MAG: DNA-3-methyladenine glycosylase I [Myxococcales bacterium]|nr:MAG: DNA-3-methyladenine glycosylase I [Myxococcales bacterium]